MKNYPAYEVDSPVEVRRALYVAQRAKNDGGVWR